MAAFEITENRAIATPFLPRPVVHTDYRWRGNAREWGSTHEPQQRIVARRHPEVMGKSRPGFATECETDPGEGSSKGVTAPRTGGNEDRELLTEGTLGAIKGATEEAAGMDQEGDGATAAGEIGDTTLVAAVDGRRGSTAEWATCRTGSRCSGEGNVVAGGTGVGDMQATPMREEGGEMHRNLLRTPVSSARKCKSIGTDSRRLRKSQHHVA